MQRRPLTIDVAVQRLLGARAALHAAVDRSLRGQPIALEAEGAAGTLSGSPRASIATDGTGGAHLGVYIQEITDVTRNALLDVLHASSGVIHSTVVAKAHVARATVFRR